MVCTIMGIKWQEDLVRITELYKFEPADQLTLTEIEIMFRQLHDGPYTMKWDHSNKIIMLQFNNDAESMWWMLQHG